jgi:hypothetical protein
MDNEKLTTIAVLVVSLYVMMRVVPKFYMTDSICLVERTIIKDVSAYSWQDDYMVKVIASCPEHPKVHRHKFSAQWRETLHVATRMAEQYANGTMHWCKVRLGARSISQFQDMETGVEREIIVPVILTIISATTATVCSLMLLCVWCNEKERAKRRSVSVGVQTSDAHVNPAMIIIDTLDV